MDLHLYADETERHCEELIEELELFGVDRLANLCKNYNEHGFMVFCERNKSDMCAYIEKTPSKRKLAHKKRSPEDRALFVMGVLFHARSGLAFLKTIVQYGIDGGHSYRSISSLAAQAANSYFEACPAYWPFEHIQDPFEQTP